MNMKRPFFSLILIMCSALFSSCSNAESISIESSTDIQRFNITFYDDDKVTPLYSTTVERGEMPVYKGATPTKKSTVEYTYQFEGWEPSLYQATKDQNYYARYKKIMNEQKELHIVRLSPGINDVTIEVDSGGNPFYVDLFMGGSAINTFVSEKSTFTIEKLSPNTEYSVVARNASFSSEKRRFITGNYRFYPINYLHPKDDCYKESGHFLGSPCLIEFKNYLFAMMDVFDNGGTNHGHLLSILYVSKNGGKDWSFVKYFRPAQWGTLFIFNEKLYFVATDLVNKGIGIFASDDGFNWSDQYRIADGDYATSPTNVAIKDNKIYLAPREHDTQGNSITHLLIGDGTKDLLEKDSWIVTNGFMPPFSLGGDQTIHYAEEGNAVEYNGEIYALYRFAYKKALMLKLVGTELQFYKVIDMECGWCKFVVKKDGDTYYAMGNNTCYPRNLISLYKSKDLEHWETVKVIEDIRSIEDIEHNGIQYPYFIIKNDKLYTLLRIALNEADTFHNSNVIGFKVFPLEND